MSGRETEHGPVGRAMDACADEESAAVGVAYAAGRLQLPPDDAAYRENIRECGRSLVKLREVLVARATERERERERILAILEERSEKATCAAAREERRGGYNPDTSYAAARDALDAAIDAIKGTA